MRCRGAVAIVALAATTAFADGVQDAHATMRAALLERAPLPAGPAVLPTAPVMPRVELTKRAEADRAARAHAHGDADAAHTDAANRAAARSMMGASRGGGQYGCEGESPADMMKSRGTMPGGGPMPGHSSGAGGSGGGGGGMQPGGMLTRPGANSTATPSGAPGALPSGARPRVDAGRR